MAAAVSCAALLAGLGAAAPAAASAARAYSAAAARPAAVPGGQLWASRYDGPTGSGGAAFALAVSPDGATVFVTGNSFGGPSGTDYATVAYNAATGAQLWARRYNGPANGDDRASELAVSPGGTTVFVTGLSRGGASSWDYATLAYNAATGAPRWVSRAPANRDNRDSSLAVSAGGATVFVTGTRRGASNLDYATVAYNAATGAPLWTRRHKGGGDGGDFAASVKVSPGGTAVFVTGSSTEGNSLSDYATVAYNAVTGARRWASRYSGPAGQSYAFGLAVSPDGTKVFVTGYTAGVTLPWEYATVAYQR